MAFAALVHPARRAPNKTKGYIIRGVALCALGSTTGSNTRYQQGESQESGVSDGW